MVTIGLLIGLPLLAAALGLRTALRGRAGVDKDAWAVLACVAAAAIFFWQVLFLPGFSFPVGGGDLVSYYWPTYHFAARSVAAGVLPFWNPTLYSGVPFAADVQSSVFYPVYLLVGVVVRELTYRALEYLLMGHIALAAIAMFLCGRLLGLGRLPALGSALTYAFSGFVIAHLGHPNVLVPAAWAPLAFGLFARALERGSPPLALGAGGIAGVAVLGAHPQMSFLLAVLLGSAALWAVWRAPRYDPRGWRWRPLLLLAITGAVAVGVSAVQLVPFVELLGHSRRQVLSYAEATKFALDPRGLILFIVPGFFGRTPAQYWSLSSLTESYGYLGLLPLLLMGLGLLVPRGHPWRGYLALLALGGLLLALGESTVLHGLAYRFLPGFDRLRVPGRFLFLVTFALSLLAACGLQALQGPLRPRLLPSLRFVLRVGTLALLLLVLSLPWLAHAVLTSQDKDAVLFQRTVVTLESGLLSALFLSLALGLLWAYRRRPGPWVLGAALVLIAFDLFSANHRFNLTNHEPTQGYDHPAIAAFLARQERPFRIDPVTGIADRFQPSWSQLWGFEDVWGDFNPLLLREYHRYWENLGSRSNPAYDLLGARYLIGTKDVPLDWSKFEPVFTDAPHLNVYRNRAALPAALFVPRAEVVASDELWRRLREGPWDPRSVLLVTEPPPPLAGPPANTSWELVRWERPTPNTLHLHVRASGAGYLLVSQNHYPGWRAMVDGRTVPVFRANGIFLGLPIEQGDHVIHLSFEPTAWRWALAVTVTTWAFVSVALFLQLTSGHLR